MGTSIISPTGDVTIPPELRTRYGLEAGDEVRFVDYGGQFALVPAFRDPIHQGEGMFDDGGGSLVEALLEERALDRARER